ncbi:hypothetical protein Salat_1493500 [Sesamum alatum]|uniref:Uncharacterized protein n=1 Tax=Sesamum alatum TaxID=300844 RepID=A0AAE1YCF6_9LAMI|nr:hypothetical protein Salat_1493500 [Sesamum alatum]
MAYLSGSSLEFNFVIIDSFFFSVPSQLETYHDCLLVTKQEVGAPQKGLPRRPQRNSRASGPTKYEQRQHSLNGCLYIDDLFTTQYFTPVKFVVSPRTDRETKKHVHCVWSGFNFVGSLLWLHKPLTSRRFRMNNDSAPHMKFPEPCLAECSTVMSRPGLIAVDHRHPRNEGDH